MSRIELSENFYEDEVREGFYVPACVKQAWGAQIQVLNDVDRVCSELGIKYFAAWGTLLGAVRHGGFVPWDDDFDICMLRNDYNRFLMEGVPRLPEGYAVFNLETREDHEQFIVNIVSKTRICFEEDHLEKFHGFPYISAVDVYLTDYIAPDSKRQDIMKKKASYVLKLSDNIREGNVSERQIRMQLGELKRLLNISVPEGMSMQQIRQFLDIEAEKLFAAFVNERDDAQQIAQMMPWGLKDIKIMPKWYYSQTVDIPFETGTIPVPLVYDDVLKCHYGDYMQLYKNAGGHDYPFFMRSRAQLQEVLDFELPEYKVDAAAIMKQADVRRTENGNTYKEIAQECLCHMRNLLDEIGSFISRGMDDEDVFINTCVDIQQLSIDLGTYMEAIKGEGYDLVGLLENLCEGLYELTQIVVSNKKTDSQDIISEKYGYIEKSMAVIRDTVNRRREILFLPFKDKYWRTMEHLYRSAENDPDMDVYVIPIPYYHKDYKGQLRDMQFREDYPADIKLTHYDDYDYAVHHPDIIVIQNPYDNYNDEMSVPPFFYSDKLLKMTDRLVYVPWFDIYDFTRENEREYINMKWYCTMPGVVNADAVILKTEILRSTYIEKLCDFAGEETRSLWDRKIMVDGSPECEGFLGFRKYAIDDGGSVNCEETVGKPEKSDVMRPERKTLLYYPDFSDIVLHGSQAIVKMTAVLKIFAGYGDSINCFFLKGRLIEDKLKDYDMGLYDKYMEVIENAGKTMHGMLKVVNETETDYVELVKKCYAYYGDAGHLAHMFRNAGKPVMIQNYEL